MNLKSNNSSSSKKVKLAIIGCGAIAELGHLPGAMRNQDVDVTVLVDRDIDRAKRLAHMFQINRVETDIARASEFADAACICLPPHHHRSSAETLLNAGLHVLMEKPLAPSVNDCDAMIREAEKNGKILAVAMMRRFAKSSGYLKALLESGMLGAIKNYTARSGSAEAWPSRSPFAFNVQQAGGGALISNGCHDVDLMIWLLGPIRDFEYLTDSMQRMEGNCFLNCKMQNGAEATIEVSRTRTLSNQIRIEGEFGVAIAPLMGETVTIIPKGCSARAVAQGEGPVLDYAGVMSDQLANFANAIRGLAPPLVDGKAGRDLISVVESCYARAKPMELPWDLPIDVALTG